MPTPIYHITHISNLDQIMAAGSLVCVRRKPRHVSIAYSGIQRTRSSFRVPLEPFGVLHDYVPFYFAPRSPMLCAISHGRVETYCEGQDPVIYLVSSVKRVMEVGGRFVFTDGHATMALSNYYTNWRDHRSEIDWSIMESKYWHDTQEHPDRKRRREAEFLVYDAISIDVIDEIVVKSKVYAERVRAVLDGCQVRIPVQIRSAWYF